MSIFALLKQENMANIIFKLNYIVENGITKEDAIENVKEMILEDGISSAINEDNLVLFTEKKTLINHIPNLNGLFNATKGWIETHQEKRGYIDTWNGDGKCDDMYAIAYDDRENRAIEMQIMAVRVKHDEIEIALDWDYNYITTEKDFREYLEDDDNWYPIMGGDVVYFNHTIFEIAGSIEQYVEE